MGYCAMEILRNGEVYVDDVSDNHFFPNFYQVLY